MNNYNRRKQGKEEKKAKKYLKESKIHSRPNRKKCLENQPYCMSCSSINSLSPHHIIFKSQGGDDRMSNLIVLCFDCHRKAHDGYWKMIVGRPDFAKVIFIAGRSFVLKLLIKLNMNLYEETLERLRNEI